MHSDFMELFEEVLTNSDDLAQASLTISGEAAPTAVPTSSTKPSLAEPMAIVRWDALGRLRSIKSLRRII